MAFNLLPSESTDYVLGDTTNFGFRTTALTNELRHPSTYCVQMRWYLTRMFEITHMTCAPFTFSTLLKAANSTHLIQLNKLS